MCIVIGFGRGSKIICAVSSIRLIRVGLDGDAVVIVSNFRSGCAPETRGQLQGSDLTVRQVTGPRVGVALSADGKSTQFGFTILVIHFQRT